MRHEFQPPFSVRVTSRFGTVNPQTLPLPDSFGIRKAREVARDATRHGEENAAFAVVLDAAGKQVFEVRNIAGKPVQVSK